MEGMMSDKEQEGNGWVEWKRKVLSDLERLGGRLDKTVETIGHLCSDIAVLTDLREDVKALTIEVGKLREDIAVIKTKLATYGAVSGAISGIAVAIITALILRAVGL